MLKRFGLQVATLVAILLLMSSDLMAQTRIRFARGRSSATVSGTLRRDAIKTYVLRAKGGQSISVTISSRNGKVQFADNEATDEVINADETRDYEIPIQNGGASTRYTLTVSIR